MQVLEDLSRRVLVAAPRGEPVDRLLTDWERYLGPLALKVLPVSPALFMRAAGIVEVVVGQDHFLERVLVAILAQGHLLVEGVPGLAKTLTVKTLARTIRGSFKRIQFTPDLVPADLVGPGGGLQPERDRGAGLGVGAAEHRGGPVLAGQAESPRTDQDVIAWELFGNHALRQGDWKLRWEYKSLGKSDWELFNLAADPAARAGDDRDLAVEPAHQMATYTFLISE